MLTIVTLYTTTHILCQKMYYLCLRAYVSCRKASVWQTFFVILYTGIYHSLTVILVLIMINLF